MKNFHLKQIKLINIMNACLLVYVIFLCWWFGLVYARNPDLLYWLRAFTILAYIPMGIQFNVDIFREKFIGMLIFKFSAITEITGLLITTLFSVLFCFKLGYEFYGLLIGQFLGQIFVYVMYYIYFIFGEPFEKYHQLKDEKPLCGSITDSLNRVTESYSEFSRDSEIIGKKEETKKQTGLKTWRIFFEFEFTFVALLFQEVFWNRLDTLITSFYFTEAEIATQASWNTSLMVVDCFAYGFGMAMTSVISEFIIKQVNSKFFYIKAVKIILYRI